MEYDKGLQECKGVLRFEVSSGSEKVEAFLSKATCEAAQKRVPDESSLIAFYQQHQSILESIVLDKISAGARHPVVVMARDLQSQPGATDFLCKRVGVQLMTMRSPN
jgi:hypothetical protein